MPDSLNPQQQVWVTLPQALRWIMANEMPTPENRELLPTFPNGDTSREDLFRHWIDGRLKLYGLDGFDPRRPCTPLKSYLTYQDDCSGNTDYVWVRPQYIEQAGFDSIDWKAWSLGHFFLKDGDPDSFPYFVDLRVRWDDLAKLPISGKLPDTARGIGECPSADIEQDKFKADDEPTGAAEPSKLVGLKKQALQGVIEMPSEADRGTGFAPLPSTPEIYQNKLLHVIDAVRKLISDDPARAERPWTQESIKNVAEQIDPSLTRTELSTIARALTDDRFRGKP